jgi:hypothetical protein
MDKNPISNAHSPTHFHPQHFMIISARESRDFAKDLLATYTAIPTIDDLTGVLALHMTDDNEIVKSQVGGLVDAIASARVFGVWDQHRHPPPTVNADHRRIHRVRYPHLQRREDLCADAHADAR